MLETRLHRVLRTLDANKFRSSSLFLSCSSVSRISRILPFMLEISLMPIPFLDVLSSFMMLFSIFLCPPLNYLTG